MTTGTIQTKGSELFFVDGLTSTTASVVKMACPTGITGLGGAADQIDITCLDSIEREFVAGFANPGQITVPFNLIPSQTSHQVLFDLKEAATNFPCMICLSEGTAQPNLDTNDNLDAPAGRTSFGFMAYIADVNLDLATNEIVRGTLVLQRSGAVTPYWNA